MVGVIYHIEELLAIELAVAHICKLVVSTSNFLL